MKKKAMKVEKELKMHEKKDKKVEKKLEKEIKESRMMRGKK